MGEIKTHIVIPSFPNLISL